MIEPIHEPTGTWLLNKVISSLTSRFELEIETSGLRILNRIQRIVGENSSQEIFKCYQRKWHKCIRKDSGFIIEKKKKIYFEDMDIHGEVSYTYLVGSTVNL